MKRIVVGYDASPAADRALERVIEIARALEATVVVASVAPVHEVAMRGAGTRYDPVDSPAEHTRMANDGVARLAEHGVEATPVTGLGHTAETLVELAAASDADLIVVGASHPHVLTPLFGGVGEDVSSEARCDVLVVH